MVRAASFLIGYFPNYSSFGIRAFQLEDLGQPIVWFVYFPLFSRQQWKQAGEGIDANVFVLFGEAQFSTLEPEAVSDFVRVTGTLDFFDSDYQSLHDNCKMDKSGFNLNVSHMSLADRVEIS